MVGSKTWQEADRAWERSCSRVCWSGTVDFGTWLCSSQTGLAFNQPVLVSILWHDVSHAVRLLLELLIGQPCVRQTVEEWDTGQGGSSVPRTLRSSGFSSVANCRHRCESVKKSRLDCGSGFLLVGWQFDHDGGSTLRLLQSGHQGEDSRGLQGHLKVGDDLGEAGTNIWRHVPSSDY